MCQTTNQISTQSWSLQNLQAVNAAALGGWGPSAFSASSPSGTSMGGDDDMALRWLNVFSRFFPAVSGCFFVFSDALVHLPKKTIYLEPSLRWRMMTPRTRPQGGPCGPQVAQRRTAHLEIGDLTGCSQAQVGWFIAFKPWIPKSPVKNELFIHPIVGFLRFSASPRDTPFWCLILPPVASSFSWMGRMGRMGHWLGGLWLDRIQVGTVKRICRGAGIRGLLSRSSPWHQPRLATSTPQQLREKWIGIEKTTGKHTGWGPSSLAKLVYKYNNNSVWYL